MPRCACKEGHRGDRPDDVCAPVQAWRAYWWGPHYDRAGLALFLASSPAQESPMKVTQLNPPVNNGDLGRKQPHPNVPQPRASGQYRVLCGHFVWHVGHLGRE
jgi:hypothetical protein